MSHGFKVKVLRQADSHSGSHWETFEVEPEEGMNVTTVLQRIAAHPETVDHEKSTPVAYDSCCLEEVCGACTMVINGKVRQACSALVDNLLKDSPGEIELRPMAKFPVVRDLLVDRKPMFEALKRVKAWVRVDGYHDLGAGPRIWPQQQDEAYARAGWSIAGTARTASRSAPRTFRSPIRSPKQAATPLCTSSASGSGDRINKIEA